MKSLYYGVVFVAAFALSSLPQPSRAETLEEALALAYQHNPELQAGRAKLRATDEQVSQALSGWRPDVTASAEAGKARQNVSGNALLINSGDVTPRDVNLNVTQPVFSGFRTVSQVRSAEAAVKAQRAVLEEAEQKLLLDTSKAYLDVVQAQRVLELNRDQESILQNELADTQDRLHIGELKKTDVSQADARLKASSVARMRAEGDLVNQQTTYARLTGQLPGTLSQPAVTADFPKDEDRFIDLALAKNPAVIAAEYNARSARNDIAAARGGLLPQVSLVGTLTDSREQSSLSPEKENSAEILARVSLPLYRTGSDYSKTRAAQQTATEKRLDLDDARNKTRENAANARQSFLTAKAAVEGQNAVVAAAEDALKGVKIEATYGTRTTLDVLNAEQELLQDKIALVKAEHDEALALLQVRVSIGQLTAEAMRLPVEIYDPDKNYNKVRGQWIGFANEEE